MISLVKLMIEHVGKESPVSERCEVKSFPLKKCCHYFVINCYKWAGKRSCIYSGFNSYREVFHKHSLVECNNKWIKTPMCGMS